MTLAFRILDWSAWAPEPYSEVQSSPDGSGTVGDTDVAPAVAPDVKDLPMSLRRRLSPAGKMALRVAYDVGCGKSDRLVFSSRYGDCNQTVAMLKDLATETPLSPARFSTSVHNAYAGLLSIASGNRQSHTAIAAGPASFCAGLTEAICLALDDPGLPVVLVQYDVPVAAFYEVGDDLSPVPVALALRLVATGTEGQAVSFSCRPSEDDNQSSGDPTTAFVEFLAQEQAAWKWTDGTTEWTCEKHAA
ncbi:MAG: beta-ketoacyl synthase chain length factor [Magnetovibrionaceae bacterium]